jgi:hypothetical protein
MALAPPRLLAASIAARKVHSPLLGAVWQTPLPLEKSSAPSRVLLTWYKIPNTGTSGRAPLAHVMMRIPMNAAKAAFAMFLRKTARCYSSVLGKASIKAAISRLRSRGFAKDVYFRTLPEKRCEKRRGHLEVKVSDFAGGGAAPLI